MLDWLCICAFSTRCRGNVVIFVVLGPARLTGALHAALKVFGVVQRRARVLRQ